MSPLAKAYSARGASMGRPSRRADAEATVKFSLGRVYLDRGGYDAGGAYWGHGKPLYRYIGDDGAGDGFLRATDRADARVQVLALFPNARFYR